MRKFIILFDLLILFFFVQLSRHCSAQEQYHSGVASVSKQNIIDPADMEVIKELDLLQNWDIVGPEGPDLNQLGVLNAQTTTGVRYGK